MNVDFIVKDPGVGGISNYGNELQAELTDFKDLEISIRYTNTPDIPLLSQYLLVPLNVREELKRIPESTDVVHLPSQFLAPGLLGTDQEVPVVVTVHDLIPIVSDYGSPLLSRYSRLVLNALHKADAIVAISEFTKSDILENTDVEEKNIHVIHPAIDEDRYTGAADKSVFSQYEIEEPYILYVGSQGSRKNVETIIAALTDVDSDLSFVIAGSTGNPLQSYRTQYYARKHGVADRVIQTGSIDIEVLNRLYESASAFVFPSQYEGFGRPPLESMSFETPVIASSATAVPEIVGQAALLCDPNHPDMWAKAINRVLANHDLRQQLTQKGSERIKEFSWTDTAKETIDLYEKLV